MAWWAAAIVLDHLLSVSCRVANGGAKLWHDAVTDRQEIGLGTRRGSATLERARGQMAQDARLLHRKTADQRLRHLISALALLRFRRFAGYRCKSP